MAWNGMERHVRVKKTAFGASFPPPHQNFLKACQLPKCRFVQLLTTFSKAPLSSNHFNNPCFQTLLSTWGRVQPESPQKLCPNIHSVEELQVAAFEPFLTPHASAAPTLLDKRPTQRLSSNIPVGTSREIPRPHALCPGAFPQSAFAEST